MHDAKLFEQHRHAIIEDLDKEPTPILTKKWNLVPEHIKTIGIQLHNSYGRSSFLIYKNNAWHVIESNTAYSKNVGQEVALHIHSLHASQSLLVTRACAWLAEQWKLDFMTVYESISIGLEPFTITIPCHRIIKY
jgi:hypothetical protein